MPSNVIVVMSPKGGVGKTTVSVNLAAALASIGKRVLIVDANLDTPHVAIYYGFVGYKNSLEDVLNGKIQVNEAIYKTENPNLHILPARVFKNKGDGNAQYKLINLFHHLGRIAESYDFLILDSKPSAGLDFVKLIKNASMLIVSMPEIASMIEAKKLNEESMASGVRVLGIVLNRVNKKISGHMNDAEVSRIVETKNIWKIPEDFNVFEALKKGIPIVWQNQKSLASKAFLELAREVASRSLHE